MKKFLFLALTAFLLSSCACGYFSCGNCDNRPFGYISGEMTSTGVRYNVTSWKMPDLAVYRRGLIIEVAKNDTLIRRYDIRIPNQRIEESFNATNFYGQAIVVKIRIYGYGAQNTLSIDSGIHQNSWKLR